MIRDSVVAYLLEQPALTPYVATRIHAMRVMDNQVTPYITVTQVSGHDWCSLQGPSGTVAIRLQLNCVGRTNAEAQRVAAVLTLPVRQGGIWNGLGPRFTMGIHTIQSCYVDDEKEFDIAPRAADNRAAYVVAIDTLITYERA